MRLYSGMSPDFVRDATRNQIAGKLKDAFFRSYGYNPSPNEVMSWQNSLRAMSDVVEAASLTDHGVILEYQLPLTSSRLDCLLCGQDDSGAAHAVIVELKQWQGCQPAFADELVLTWLAGAEREVLHPSVQVHQYQLYLEDTHTAFYEEPGAIQLSSCAYLHNYEPHSDDVIFSTPFAGVLDQSPTFTADDFTRISEYLSQRLEGGSGRPLLARIEESKFRPSKKLMEHVAGVIQGTREYVLLDEQRVVFDKVVACSRQGFDDRRKSVIIVKGGPGTGKSVIAINLMAELLRAGLNAHYATGSRAFTKTLRKVIGPRGQVQFKFFNSYMQAEVNAVDVLICDEAHRIREFSHNRFTPRAEITQRPQIDEILQAAKVSVFLIDDDQTVRPNEIGSAGYIKDYAEAHNCRVSEYELEAQFRCAGSDGFVNWVNNTLGIKRTANALWDGAEGFEFRIFDTPDALEAAIRAKVHEGFSGRMTAGYCWPWSKPTSDGTLIDDVVVGAYRRPWNAKPEATRLARGIPSAELWAHEAGGIDQVGCIYTAQGFEFDYVGVIFATDLRYDLDRQAWEGHPEDSQDTVLRRARGRFCELAKNSYRVLLSRGLKGCFVHFIDKDTERFVRSRMTAGSLALPEPENVVSEAPIEDSEDERVPFRRLPPSDVEPFINCVPVYDIADVGRLTMGAIEGRDEVASPAASCDWAQLPPGFTPGPDLFVMRLRGLAHGRLREGSWILGRRTRQVRAGALTLVRARGTYPTNEDAAVGISEPQPPGFPGHQGERWPTTKPTPAERHDLELTDEPGEGAEVIAEIVAQLV